MKRLLLVHLVPLLLAAPAALQAQFSYTTNTDNTITISGYSGPDGAVIIPATAYGLPVTGIGNYAFDNNGGLTSITIGTNVTSIGYLAFFECTSLTNVILPESVTSIGNAAFWYCTSLTGLTIPTGVTNIGEVEFAFSGLTNVTIPGNVTCIEKAAFEACFNLSNVTIPAGVTKIGLGAFDACSNLTSITMPGSVTNIGAEAFSYCPRLTSVYFIGNAPVTDSTAFADHDAFGNVIAYDNATLYYLPGTSGWSSTFASMPAILWNPLIQTSDATFGLHNNQFAFNITGTANIPIVVEACASLLNPVWLPVQTLTLTNGLFHFTEPVQPNISSRYYRITSQ